MFCQLLPVIEYVVRWIKEDMEIPAVKIRKLFTMYGNLLPKDTSKWMWDFISVKITVFDKTLSIEG